MKTAIHDLMIWWKDPELACDEYQRKKLEEMEIKKNLDAATKQYEEKILELELRIRQVRKS